MLEKPQNRVLVSRLPSRNQFLAIAVKTCAKTDIYVSWSFFLA